MKINFIYANIYQGSLNPGIEKPSESLVNKKLKMIEAFWKKNERNVEQSVGKITGLQFKKGRSIDCYLNTEKSFSEPLTLKMQEDKDMGDTLVHELMHVLLAHNHETGGWELKKMKKFLRDFKDEPMLTRNHILVHAMHYLIYKDIMPERIDAILNYSKRPEYVRAWEIVNKIGAEELIEKYL